MEGLGGVFGVGEGRLGLGIFVCVFYFCFYLFFYLLIIQKLRPDQYQLDRTNIIIQRTNLKSLWHLEREKSLHENF